MTDYTPTTEQVRDAYVRGMRDTFIASAGEHYEEFDRWVEAHDEEVPASVQPPTREQIEKAVEPVVRRWFDTGGSLRAMVTDAVLALVPQPGPSAEQTLVQVGGRRSGKTSAAIDALLDRASERGIQVQIIDPTTEPVSIADMAPGTTFTTNLLGATIDYRVTVPADGYQFHLLGWATPTWVHRDDIDPSTIRDVTPPPATPKEGNRG